MPDGPLDARTVDAPARPDAPSDPAPHVTILARPAHRRGRRRRRRPAGPGARRGGRLAAARRAEQRLPHRRERAPVLPAAARRRPRRSRSSGSSSAATRRCPGRSPGCCRATTSRCSTLGAGGLDRAAVRRSTARSIDPAVDGADDPAWLEEWQAADASVAAQLDALLAAEPDLTPYDVAGAVSRALPAGGLLVVGASSPIRDLDLMAPRYAVGEPPQGDRQPRPVRHRRHRLDRDRRRPGPAAQQPRASR